MAFSDDRMEASEWLERLADAFERSREQIIKVCVEKDCEIPIRRGVRCESCRKKKHAAAERARVARERIKESRKAEEANSTETAVPKKRTVMSDFNFDFDG